VERGIMIARTNKMDGKEISEIIKKEIKVEGG
jgi:hypothetical protein